jgi:hypothetical protein
MKEERSMEENSELFKKFSAMISISLSISRRVSSVRESVGSSERGVADPEEIEEGGEERFLGTLDHTPRLDTGELNERRRMKTQMRGKLKDDIAKCSELVLVTE